MISGELVWAPVNICQGDFPSILGHHKKGYYGQSRRIEFRMTQIMTNGLLPNLDEKNKAEVDKLFDVF